MNLAVYDEKPITIYPMPFWNCLSWDLVQVRIGLTPRELRWCMNY